MTERCADLDEFFDGELADDQAEAFREHLSSCPRCQMVLHGRMQENISAHLGTAIGTEIGTGSGPGVAPELDFGAGTGMAMAAQAERHSASEAVDDVARARSSRGARRIIAYLAPVLAAAIGIPLALRLVGSSDTRPRLAVEIQRGEASRGTKNAHVGDVLRSHIASDGGQAAIWVYLDNDLWVACPGDARCRQASGELVLELPIRARGKYTVIGLGAAEVTTLPRGKTLDEIRAAHPAIDQASETVTAD
jgi:anti-sigma factor RsiW